jgi:uncharacterized repeat protein (TIGR03803 family)
MKLVKALKLISYGVALSVLAPFAQGQTFSNLHTFVGMYEKSLPYGGLIESGTTLYGTTWGGGVGTGTVFKINSDGSGKATLHEFSTFGAGGTNSDGANPYASLFLSGTTLYGTASAGGASGFGTVFKVNTDGSGFATLYTFTDGSDGGTPMGSLIVSNNTLYGTASAGGASGFGAVFKVGTTGTGFTTVYTFTDLADGANPMGSLILSSGTLYGTAFNGGFDEVGFGFGTVFSVTTAGANFNTIFAFEDGADGANPAGGLVLSGSTLYGTTSMGGQGENYSEAGAVFQVNTNGSNFNTLHDFGYDLNDGANPYSTLAISGTTLYGTTTTDGTNGTGTVFAIGVTTSGSSFRLIHAFGPLVAGTNSDGALPYAGVSISSGTLYGAAAQGGTGATGALYSVKAAGGSFTNFHSFSSVSSADFPRGTAMILSGTTFYGTTEGDAGVNDGDSGTVFSINEDGSGFSVLHAFSYVTFNTMTGLSPNSDGAGPYGGLVLSGTTLFGTAVEGGTTAGGTLYKVNVNGSGFTVLHTFPSPNNVPSQPYGALALSGSTIYGTTAFGGADGFGAVYSIHTDGSGFTTLYSFTNGADGVNPFGVLLSSGTLFGVTQGAATGTLFKVNVNGANFTTIHTFAVDGSTPQGTLVLSGTTLYGVTFGGGTHSWGTIFSIGIDGSGKTTLYNFTGGDDGGNPMAGLALSGGTLYGTTNEGGANDDGSVFSLTTSGASFTTLYSFTGTTDGADPDAGLTLSGGTIYGTASAGGDFGAGTVFSVVP